MFSNNVVGHVAIRLWNFQILMLGVGKHNGNGLLVSRAGLGNPLGFNVFGAKI